MISLLTRFVRGYQDFYTVEQLDSFFSWLALQPSSRKELTYIQLPSQIEFRECVSGKERRFSSHDVVSFVICEPGGLQESVVTLLKRDNSQKSWFLIFYSPDFEIWENKLRHTNILPLRFGLSKTERVELTALARDSMNAYFTNQEMTNSRTNFSRLDQVATADVVLWIGGQLRGSCVVIDRPLREGIVATAKFVLNDYRFKPVSAEELKNAWIEIAIMQGPCIRLSQKNIEEYFLDGRRGYVVTIDKRREWYFTGTFNSAKFEDLKELTTKLVYKKAKLSVSEAKHAFFSTYLVEAFIENPTNKEINALDGPVVKQHVQPEASDMRNLVHRHSLESAKWLLQMQDTEGYMPLYVDPIARRFGKTDWIRLAHTAYALLFYGRVVGKPIFVTAGAKAFYYVYGYVFEKISDESAKRTTLLYLGEAALQLGDIEKVDDISRYLKIPWNGGGTNFYANLASFFASLYECSQDETLLEATAFGELVYSDFKKKREQNAAIAPTSYAQLIHTFFLLYKITKEDAFIKKSEEMGDWLKEQQLENGAFASKTGSKYIYTRGSAKMFEVLATDVLKYRESVESCLNWLIEMKYSNENTYFVAPEFKKCVIGGLRHDLANPEAWIDGAAHFLIGAARILENSRR